MDQVLRRGWTHDGSGFFYSRYPEPTGSDALRAVNRFQKLYYHRLGTDQAADVLVYEQPDQPDWGVNRRPSRTMVAI